MTMKKEAAARICPVCGAESDRTHRVYWNFYEKTGSRRWGYDRCPACGAAVRSHRACPKCGTYKGRKVVAAAK